MAGDCGSVLAATNVVTAVANTVLSSAVPIDPPTCWVVLTIADATPESLAFTPMVPTSKQQANTRPRPRPVTSRPGSTWVTYAVSTPI